MTDPFVLTTPVAFFIFNRPAVTERVFQAIRSARPAKLFIVADGPRDDRPGEAEKCAACREIVERIDWQCEVERNYSDINLGCRRRVSSGIDWVFSIVEEAIILEDDCLPEPTFFRFCQEMLDHYRNDERIMMVSGTNALGEWKQQPHSYHFSFYACIWGWATWRSAWHFYDVDLKMWRDADAKKNFEKRHPLPGWCRYDAKSFDMVADGKIDTWDYQWTFALMNRSGLSIVPSVNLISNIGIGSDATHTTNEATRLNRMPIHPLPFPLQHRMVIDGDPIYSGEYIKLMASQETVVNKVRDATRIALRFLRKLTARFWRMAI